MNKISLGLVAVALIAALFVLAYCYSDEPDHEDTAREYYFVDAEPQETDSVPS